MEGIYDFYSGMIYNDKFFRMGNGIRDDSFNKNIFLKYVIDMGPCVYLDKYFTLNPNEINDKIENGRTALSLASQRDIDTILVLLKHGADTNIRDDFGKTALFYAVNSGFLIRAVFGNGTEVNTTYLLLENGADVNIRDEHNRTALMYANVNTIPILLKYGADVNYVDVLGDTPLHFFINNSMAREVKILVDNGADINALNKNNVKAVNLAIGKLKFELIEPFIFQKMTITNLYEMKSLIYFMRRQPPDSVLKIYSSRNIKFNLRAKVRKEAIKIVSHELKPYKGRSFFDLLFPRRKTFIDNIKTQKTIPSDCFRFANIDFKLNLYTVSTFKDTIKFL